MYPAPNFYVWFDNPYAAASDDPNTGKKSETARPQLGSWDRLEAEKFQYLRDPDFPWTADIGRRRLIVTMEQWTEWKDSVRYDIKTEPDYRRMGAEIGIALVVGLGLCAALIRRRSPATPSQ
jgi:hypothetical protein